MKKLILILFAFLSFTLHARAQTEFIKRDEQKKVCLYGVTHINDKENNTYFLTRDGYFNEENGMMCGSPFSVTPHTLYKFGQAGKIVWQTNFGNDVRYAQQLFDRDSVIVIVFYVNGGAVSSSGIDFGSSVVPYYALIRKSDGKVIKRANLCFYCKFNDHDLPYYLDGPDVAFFKVAWHKDNSISCIQTVNRRYAEKLNDNSYVTHDSITLESFDLAEINFENKLTVPAGKNICMYDDMLHDEADDKYIITDSAGLLIYDRYWKSERRIALPGIDTLHYPYYKIAYNSKYYVVNYGSEAYGHNHIHFTTVITKTGKVISTKESPAYEVSGINKHNIIYAVVKPVNDDTTEHPVQLISMNKEQKHRKEKHIGPAYARVNSLSFTGSDELILTGTCMTTGSQKLPKTPSGIYYYKEQLKRR